MTFRNVNKEEPWGVPSPPSNVRRTSGNKSFRSEVPRSTAPKKSQSKKSFNGLFDGFIGDDFESSTVNSVAKVGRFAWSVMVRIALYGMVIGATVADIFGGAVALALIFTNPSEFAGISVGSAIISTGISMFTSGIQILLFLMFTKGGRVKMDLTQKIMMFGIMIADTLFDMTVPFWWSYGETPLNMVWTGKPFMFYVSVLVFTAVCLSAERVTLLLAKMAKRGS